LPVRGQLATTLNQTQSHLVAFSKGNKKAPQGENKIFSLAFNGKYSVDYLRLVASL
jgi:hypothetical protein